MACYSQTKNVGQSTTFALKRS